MHTALQHAALKELFACSSGHHNLQVSPGTAVLSQCLPGLCTLLRSYLQPASVPGSSRKIALNRLRPTRGSCPGNMGRSRSNRSVPHLQ